MGWSVLWAHTNHQQSIEKDLTRLRTFVEVGYPVTLSLGGLERGWWNITDLSINIMARQQGTNAATRATVALTMTEVNDVRVKIARRTPTPRTPPRTPTPRTPPRTYVVRGGDTLSGIASRLLGRASRFTEIARLNRISNPYRLRVGQRLKIPAR